MKKQDSLQAFALAQADLLSVKGGAFKVSFQRQDGSHGFIVTDVVDDVRIGGTLPSTNFIVIDIVDGI